MNIGLMIKWPKGSLNRISGNVIGDELLGESLCAAIKRTSPNCKAELYAPNNLPKSKLDVMVYLNDIKPIESYSKTHVVYLQNGGYDESGLDLLKRFTSYGYDGHIFFSNKLKELHSSMGGYGLFLPFGVDTNFFKPEAVQIKFNHEVAYVGNDIKGEVASEKYLYPAIDFEFGLYGNWRLPKSRFRFWNNWKKVSSYKDKFEKISRGKILQSDISSLYSSAKINLNCTLQDCIDWDVITLRTFEVLACRGFLISDVVPIAQETMAGCMVFTQGGSDLRDQIAYYLSHEKERQEIAENGYAYVLKHASVDARAKELVNYLDKVVK